MMDRHLPNTGSCMCWTWIFFLTRLGSKSYDLKPGHWPNHWCLFERRLFFTRRFIGLGLLLAGAIRAGKKAVPEVDPAPLVKSVAVMGTRVPVNLRTQAGQLYDARVAGKDVHELWSTGRFDDIRAETRATPDGIAVVFRVIESPELRLHAMRIDPSSFGLRLKAAEGTPIDRRRVQEMALEAGRQLEAQGYVNARVDYNLAPVSKHQADLRLILRAGDAVDVKEVEFQGDLGLERKELDGALRALRIRRMLPAIPGLWGGWRLFPAYSEGAVDSDLSRLRSLYLSKGFFDPNVRLGGVEIREKAAAVKIVVEAGPRYRVREWSISGAGVVAARVHPSDLRSGELCSCLAARRRDRERLGILDFSVRLKVDRVTNETGLAGGPPDVNLTTAIHEGQPYRVGRIEFFGNHRYTDAAVRSNFVLEEGRWFDRQLLRKSIARLNRTMQFEPLDESAVQIHPNPQTGYADVTVRLAERKRRAWSVSGPVGPLSFAGPLQASLSSRLPAWGQGILELSTYTASISLLAFAHPLLPLLPISSKRHVLPILALERPFTPGEGWKSGFVVAPQIGWRRSILSYAATQIQQRLWPALSRSQDLNPGLTILVERPQGDIPLTCEQPKPRFAKPRSMAAIAIRLLGAF